MRHYFGYDIDGNLRSVEAYGPAGWPATHCLEDGSCEQPAVTSLWESRADDTPAIVNWVVYDCPCDPAAGALLRDCVCFNAKFAESYVDPQTKTLKTKPTRQIYVDGEVIESGSIITRAPGTTITFKLVSANMPDDEVVRCIQRGTVDIAENDEWELVFQGGETPEGTLIAPAQGTRGSIVFTGKLLRPANFFLRGFAAPV